MVSKFLIFNFKILKILKTKIKNAKTGAFALLDTLIRNSTRHIFGYPGGAILPIYDELYFWERQNLINHILQYIIF